MGWLHGEKQAVGTHRFEVGCELVKEVVDDVSSEDPDAQALSHFPGFPGDRHVKGQQACKLLAALLKHHAGTHHILLVHRPNVDAGHRNLDGGGLEELQEGFQ